MPSVDRAGTPRSELGTTWGRPSCPCASLFIAGAIGCDGLRIVTSPSEPLARPQTIPPHPGGTWLGHGPRSPDVINAGGGLPDAEADRPSRLARPALGPAAFNVEAR